MWQVENIKIRSKPFWLSRWVGSVLNNMSFLNFKFGGISLWIYEYFDIRFIEKLKMGFIEYIHLRSISGISLRT